MLNQVVLVGRLFGEITLEQEELDAGETRILLDVERRDKTNRIGIILNIEIAKQVQEYLTSTTVKAIAIKGYLEETMDGETRVVAEKVTPIGASYED